jgi:L-cysteine desulfidase
MTLTKSECADILALIKREVVPAIGCTEPMAVALAVAKATELLGQKPRRVDARLSGNIIKNAMGVGIPGSGGMVGLKSAIALGAVGGKADLELEVLRDITPEQTAAARAFMAAQDSISLSLERECTDNLYIDITTHGDDRVARVIIAKQHTHYIYMSKGEEVLLDLRSELAGADADESSGSNLSVSKVFEFATKMPIDDLRFILESERVNMSAARQAFDGDYGLNLGRTMNGAYEMRMVGQSTMPRIVTYTCAACDLRMAGAKACVMSNSGSGNQGIAATLPVSVFAEDVCASESKLVRALTLSHLMVIYIKQHLGRLSAHCGCVIAATGSACGITYLMGGELEQVSAAIKNMVASLTGMICDGAKPSCSLKLSSGVSQAFQSAMMAMEDRCVSSNDGIIDDDVDRTIINLAEIGRNGMQAVDRMILQIMLNKGEQAMA